MLENFRTYNLAKELYRATTKIKAKYYLKNQMERAALRVVLNLGEGTGRRQKRDKARFYTVALGSLREVQSTLDLLERIDLYRQADTLGAHIWRLIQATQNSENRVTDN